MTALPFDFADFDQLLSAWSDGSLTDSDWGRFAAFLESSADARVAYVDYATLQAMLELAHLPPTSAEGLPANLSRTAVASRSRMDGYLRKASKRFKRLRRDTRYAVAMALCLAFVFAGVVSSLVMGVLALVRSFDMPSNQAVVVQADPPQPPPVVAYLTRVVDCAWYGGKAAPKVGDYLTAGSKLELKSGLAEITFQDGARAILEGPATLVVDSRGSADLDRGKCTVTVEHSLAGGFAINTPGMKYTDLGTEFGVLVAQSGEQEVHVFRGKVQAEEARNTVPGAGCPKPPLQAPRSATPAPRSMLLTAHQAIRLAAPGAPMVQMAADEKRFVRAILDPFPIFGTGVGLDRGAADPHWKITAISTEANFKPRPAVVAVPDPSYTPDNRDSAAGKGAQWISNSKSKDNMPPGCRWTLLAHFDLSGFNPSTARIEGQITADNFVKEIRVNGKAVSIPPGNREEELFRRWLPLSIEEDFVAGDNTLEIVIENGDGTGPDHPGPSASPMALCLELRGLALQLPKPKAGK